jgi:hypothetical protein
MMEMLKQRNKPTIVLLPLSVVGMPTLAPEIGRLLFVTMVVHYQPSGIILLPIPERIGIPPLILRIGLGMLTLETLTIQTLQEGPK